ncbi:MAG: hypothetical protein KatS3mg023_1782 [Armatimonadota bacterium]|nr:MAG: hypothetical protein KatS3mg023_1782 [Armatimonadota bacterium]
MVNKGVLLHFLNRYAEARRAWEQAVEMNVPSVSERARPFLEMLRQQGH